MSRLTTKLAHSKRGLRGGAIALSLSVLLLPACATNSNVRDAEEATENPTTADIAKETENYVGQTVSVRNGVQDIVSDYAFLLDEDAFFGGQEILVINAGDPLTLPDGEGTEVQVNGDVQRLDLAQLKQTYGLDLDPNRFAQYVGQPVIVAQSVALAPDPEEITQNPEKYYNQRIAVQGEVEDLLGNGVFTLDEEKLFGGEDLLVVPDKAGSTVSKDEEVAVTGVLRPYIKAEFERDYDFTWDQGTQERINKEYETKPVFVAEGVYPVDDDAQ